MAERDTPTRPVTIAVEEEEVQCDKDTLIANSEYFKAMFSSNMLEASADRIILKDVRVRAFRLVLSMTERNPIELVDADVLEVLSIASMLIFDEVINQCVHHLSCHISTTNCLDIMRTADKCGQTALFHKAKVYSLWNYARVVKTPRFLKLTYDDVLSYLSDKSLNVEDEGSVFSAMMLWTEDDRQERLCHLVDLMGALYKGSLSPSSQQEITSKVRSLAVLDPESIPLGMEEPGGLDGNDQLVRRGPWCVWVLGGEIHTDVNKENNVQVQVLNLHPREGSNPLLINVTTLPAQTYCKAWGYKACSSGQYLYLSGGERKEGARTQWIEEVWRYDVLEDVWEVMTTLRQPRRHHTMFAWDQCIYLLGGFGKHRILKDTVEKWCISSASWQELPKLSRPVYSAAASVCQQRVYVIKQDVETWAPGELMWTLLTMPIPFESGIQSAVTLGKRIYLTCAYGRTVYEYDVDESTCVECGQMEQACGAACALGQSLYVVSGQNAPVIERLCLRDKRPETVIELDSYFLNHCVVVLPYYSKGE